MIVDFVIALVGILFALLLGKPSMIAELEDVADSFEASKGAIFQTVFRNQEALLVAIHMIKFTEKTAKISP